MRRAIVAIFAAALLGLISNSVWSAGALTLLTSKDKQKWKSGEAYIVRWENRNAGNYVKIQLLKSGKPYKTIRAKTKNDGKYRWKIPSSVKNGSEYQIKITSTTKKTISDTSDKIFKITKKSGKTKKSKSSKVLVAAGDISECDNNNSARTAKIVRRYPTATVATLGDNAYKDGSKRDFECYDRTWGKFKKRTRPSPGNHDYRTAKAKGYFDYFGARAGKRNKGYYRYSLGDWNVVVLNSNCDHIGGCRKGSRQYRWLKKVLSKSQTTCTLAYMHHPWRSSGLHGPTANIQALGDLLSERGVDVLLSGHDHIYERFAPQRPDGRAASQGGLRQFVVGTGGREKLYPIEKISKNSEVRNNKSHGVLKLDLRSTSYRWKFVSVGAGFSDKGKGRCR